MRSDGTRDSDGMAGPVVIYRNLDTYRSVGIDRMRWPCSVKERQVAVVRPVMKTTTTTTTTMDGSISSSPSPSSVAAATVVSRSGVVSAPVGSVDNLSLNSRNIIGHSQSIVSNRLSVGNSSSPSSASSSSIASSSASSASPAAASSQFPDGVSSIPIGWENTWSFYYPNLTMSEAKQLLRPHPEGTFLLRNSSEPRYAYSLSVKTNRGTTSVRIQHMASGRYRLDCDPTQETVIPTFRSVPELIRHYLERNEEERNGTGCGRGHRYVFLESTGRMDTPVQILRPLVKDSALERRNISA